MKTKTLLSCLSLALTVAFAIISTLKAEDTKSGDAKSDKDRIIEVMEKAPEQPKGTVEKTDEEWRKILTEDQYRILREDGTERANGKVYDEFKKQGAGTYYCAGCNAELFTSTEKFDSNCGWPSFYDPSKAKNVKYSIDFKIGYKRTEVRCAVCDGHLGHVFEGEGFETPTDKRYCINGTVLKFVPAVDEQKDGKEAKKKE